MSIDGCGKVCVSRSKLDRHTLSHGEYFLYCMICNFMLYSYSCLSIYLSHSFFFTIDPAMIICCIDNCSHRVLSKASLEAHIAEAHPDVEDASRPSTGKKRKTPPSEEAHGEAPSFVCQYPACAKMFIKVRRRPTTCSDPLMTIFNVQSLVHD